MRLQHDAIEGDSDVAASQEVALLVVMELQCHERLQIRVPKCSIESDESERFQSY